MGRRPYERRLGQPFEGSIIPFGSLVEYHPTTAKDQSRIHQFGKKVLPGLFLGYALYAGRNWKGDVLIADLEELETMDASEIYSKRLNAKEVIFPKQGELIFPIADGRIKTPGGDQELRTSTLLRQRPIQGESQETSSLLSQSGLDNECWADSIECYCHLRNIQDKLSDGKTPYEKRFGMPFNRPVIPFGAVVEHHLFLRKTSLDSISLLGAKVLPGIFLGYALYAGVNLERRHCGRRH